MNSWYHIISLVFVIVYLFIGIFYIDSFHNGDDLSLFVLTIFTLILDIILIFVDEDVISEKVLFAVGIFLCIFSMESLVFFPKHFALELSGILYGGYITFKMVRSMIHRQQQVETQSLE